MCEVKVPVYLVPVYNWYINVKMSLMWVPVQFKGPRSLDSLEMQYRSMYIALGLVFAMMQTIGLCQNLLAMW